MTKIKYAKVRIRVNELHTQETSVPEWEVPILDAVHSGAVARMEDVFIYRDQPPSAEDEFRRLENRYRNTVNEDGSRGLPYVVSVYGQYGIGVAALNTAIQAAVEHVTEPVAAPAADDLIGDTKVSSVGG